MIAKPEDFFASYLAANNAFDVVRVAAHFHVPSAVYFPDRSHVHESEAALLASLETVIGRIRAQGVVRYDMLVQEIDRLSMDFAQGHVEWRLFDGEDRALLRVFTTYILRRDEALGWRIAAILEKGSERL
jgi:ketosteroid isomerase-like protein